MEKTYDSHGAKGALTALINSEDRISAVAGCERLWNFKREEYEVLQIDSPTLFKLVRYGRDSTEPEEATFLAYGIILEKDLPPVKIERRLLQDEGSRNRYAGVIRQYVAITGLNINDFNKIIEGIAKIHSFFEDSLPNESLQPMIPLVMEENVAMACHTRYFHATRFYKSAIPHPLGSGVDPNGDLQLLQGDSYVHTEDNVVQYLEKKFDDGRIKYSNINPTRFQKGDIVEVIVSFFCVPTRLGSLKMFTSLRSLILIDDQFRELARESQVRNSISQRLKVAGTHVKRRFMETEDDETLVQKYARMDL